MPPKDAMFKKGKTNLDHISIENKGKINLVQYLSTHTNKMHTAASFKKISDIRILAAEGTHPPWYTCISQSKTFLNFIKVCYLISKLKVNCHLLVLKVL